MPPQRCRSPSRVFLCPYGDTEAMLHPVKRFPACSSSSSSLSQSWDWGRPVGRLPRCPVGATVVLGTFYSTTLGSSQIGRGECSLEIAVLHGVEPTTPGGHGDRTARPPAVARRSLIGFAGLHEVRGDYHFTPAHEVGWRLAREHWGHGYATEAGAAALAFGFDEVGLDEIVAFAVADNARSRRVMERLGMSYDAVDDFDHVAFPKGHGGDLPLGRWLESDGGGIRSGSAEGCEGAGSGQSAYLVSSRRSRSGSPGGRGPWRRARLGRSRCSRAPPRTRVPGRCS